MKSLKLQLNNQIEKKRSISMSNKEILEYLACLLLRLRHYILILFGMTNQTTYTFSVEYVIIWD